MTVRFPTRAADWRLMGRTVRLVVSIPRYAALAVAVGALSLTAFVVSQNLALVACHVREHGLSAREGGGSAVGVALGALGAGCAACGSAVLAGVLSLVGAAGAVTLLPFEGLELSALAAVALSSRSTGWPTGCAAGRSTAVRSTSKGRPGSKRLRWGVSSSAP